MKPFGEFFDAINKWAEEQGNVDAKIHMEVWTKVVSPATWEEARAMELSAELFRNFAEDMAAYIRERIAGICTDALLDSTMNRGHAFLRATAEIGRQFGLEVQDDEVDVPLSLSDALVRSSPAA